MKKITAIILALVMVLGMSASVFAANDGSVAVKNAKKGETYSLYKVFDLTYSGTGNDMKVAYTYTKTGESDALFAALNGTGSPFTLTASSTANVYIVSTAETDGAVIGDWLKANVALLGTPVTKTADADATEDAPLTFTGLAYAYYFLSTTQGTLVTVDSATPNVTVEDKTTTPTVVKTAEETSASIGETVHYNVVITMQKGAENYVMHDKMSDGLTFDGEVAVTIGTGESVKTLKAGEDYTLITNPTDKDTFDVEFSEKYLKTITAATAVTVSYTATVNQKAVIGENKNEAGLTYGDAQRYDSEPETIKVYKFDLQKIDGKTKDQLEKAEFKLYSDADCTEEIALVAVTGGYRVADATETAAEGFTPATIVVGKATVSGLGDGTYYLKETNAPVGYNPLEEAVAVTIDGADLIGDNQVVVENLAGSLLPSTGGIGTTIFYVLGSIMLMGAAVLLVTKKRMTNM